MSQRVPDRRGDAAPVTRGLGVRAVVLGSVVAGVLLVFVDKAFTVDDPLFIWLGWQVLADPLDFFGFAVNWDGRFAPMFALTRNPPGAGYYVALAGGLGGFGERALHAAFLLPAVVASLGTFALAKRLGPEHRAFEAALLAALSPVFLVSSTNVMCDTLMLALWVGSLVLWLRGLDSRRPGWLVAAAALAALAGLTKYFGFALIPLLGVHGFLRARAGTGPRLGVVLASLTLTLLAAGAYELATHALYGKGLLAETVRFASRVERTGAPGPAARLVMAFTFAGGCAVFALFYAPLLFPRRTLWLGAGVGAVALAAAGLLSRVTGLSLGDGPSFYALQVVLLGLGGAALVALALGEMRRSRDPETWLLGLWLLGTLVFAAGVNWTNNGRSNLPMVPAAAILCMRALDRRPRTARSRMLRAAAFAASVAVALAVAAADYRFARDVRDAARLIAREHLTGEVESRFFGHWGFQYYLQRDGSLPVDFSGERVEPGTLLIEPTNNYAGPGEPLGPPSVELVREYAFPPEGAHWVHTQSRSEGAGFYDSVAGPLPFAFGTRSGAEPDRYRVWRARQRLRFRGPS